MSGHGIKAGIKEYTSSSCVIQVANGNLVKSSGKGNRINQTLPIKDVLICPEIPQNLLSTGSIADHGVNSFFTKSEVLMGDFTSLLPAVRKLTVAIGYRKNGSYLLHYPAIEKANLSLAEAHAKLGHVDGKLLKAMNDNNLADNFSIKDKKDFDCLPCREGKQVHDHKHLGSERQPPQRLGDDVHMDISGRITPISHRRYEYSLLITDEFSNMDNLYLLRTRKNASQYFIEFDQRFFNRHGRHTGNLHIDNEFVTNSLQGYAKKFGIRLCPIIPYESHQNGLAERKNLTHFNRCRATLTFVKAPLKYWCEALSYVVHSSNITPTAKDLTSLPYTKANGVKPNLDYIQSLS